MVDKINNSNDDQKTPLQIENFQVYSETNKPRVNLFISKPAWSFHCVDLQFQKKPATNTKSATFEPVQSYNVKIQPTLIRCVQ